MFSNGSALWALSTTHLRLQSLHRLIADLRYPRARRDNISESSPSRARGKLAASRSVAKPERESVQANFCHQSAALLHEIGRTSVSGPGQVE